MNLRIKSVLLAVALFIFLASGLSVSAQEILPGSVRAPDIGPGTGNIKIGPLEVHPFIGAVETYSDNLYQNYLGRPAESDFITTVSPGIRLLLPLRRHSLLFDYRADINLFSRFSESNYTNQQTGMAFNFDFPVGLTGSVSDYYSDAKVPRKGKASPGITGINDSFREQPYNLNDFNARIRYRFVDRWAVEGRYNNYDYAYKNNIDDSGSYNRNLFGGSVFYRFTPKTDILIEYNYSIVDYKTANINDNKNQTYYVGLSFDPTAKLYGDLKLGWGIKDYDNNLAGRNSSINTFSSLINLGYRLGVRDLLSLRVYRAIEEDLTTNAPFVNTYAYLGFRHTFSWNEKLYLNALGGYGTKKFEGSTTDADGTIKTQDDRRWYGEIGLFYAWMRWLTLGVSYNHTDNDSNFISYKYTENRVWFSATGTF